MGRCARPVEEHRPSRARHRETARTVCLVVQRDMSHLHVVGCRYSDVDMHRNPLVAVMKLGLVHRERRSTVVRLRARLAASPHHEVETLPSSSRGGRARSG